MEPEEDSGDPALQDWFNRAETLLNSSDYDHDIEERPRKNYRSYLERAKKEGWIKTLADLRDPNIEQNVSASGRPPVVAKNLKDAIHYLVRHGVPVGRSCATSARSSA